MYFNKEVPPALKTNSKFLRKPRTASGLLRYSLTPGYNAVSVCGYRVGRNSHAINKTCMPRYVHASRVHLRSIKSTAHCIIIYAPNTFSLYLSLPFPSTSPSPDHHKLHFFSQPHLRPLLLANVICRGSLMGEFTPFNQVLLHVMQIGKIQEHVRCCTG